VSFSLARMPEAIVAAGGSVCLCTFDKKPEMIIFASMICFQ
jgi:hypothetical protein